MQDAGASFQDRPLFSVGLSLYIDDSISNMIFSPEDSEIEVKSMRSGIGKMEAFPSVSLPSHCFSLTSNDVFLVLIVDLIIQILANCWSKLTLSHRSGDIGLAGREIAKRMFDG